MFNCQSSMPLFIDLPMAIQASKTLQKYQIIFQQIDLNHIPNRKNPIGRKPSAFFKKLYDLRIYIEQYNSRIGPLEFERTTLFNFKAIKNQIMIRHLALALVAAGAFEMGKEDKIRSYKTLMEDSAA